MSVNFCIAGPEKQIVNAASQRSQSKSVQSFKLLVIALTMQLGALKKTSHLRPIAGNI